MTVSIKSLKELSEGLFGIRSYTQSKEEIYKQISDHQRSIDKLIKKLRSSNTGEHTIGLENIESLLKSNPHLSDISITGDSINDSERKSILYFDKMALVPHFGNLNSSIKNNAEIYYGSPTLKYMMQFYSKTIRWYAKNGVFWTPLDRKLVRDAWQGYASKDTLELSALSMSKSEYKVPACTIINVAPIGNFSTFDNQQSHPHTSSLTSPFSEICTGGTNTFKSVWINGRIKSVSDFMEFIKNAAYWANHWNISDNFTNRAYPSPVAVNCRDIVRKEILNISARIVKCLTMPIYNAIADSYCNGRFEAYAGVNHVGDDEMPIMNFIENLKIEIENVYPFCRCRLSPRFYPYFDAGAIDPEKNYQLLDTCWLALDSVLELLNLQAPLKFQTLLLLREIAYAILLIDIFRTDRSGLSNVIGRRPRENMLDMLMQNIACSISLKSRYRDGSNPTIYIDKGYKDFFFTRRRLLAPTVMRDVLNTCYDFKRNLTETYDALTPYGFDGRN